LSREQITQSLSFAADAWGYQYSQPLSECNAIMGTSLQTLFEVTTETPWYTPVLDHRLISWMVMPRNNVSDNLRRQQQQLTPSPTSSLCAFPGTLPFLE